MCAETSTALAEISAGLGYKEIRPHHRSRFYCHVEEEDELARFLAFIENLLVHDHHEVPDLAVLVLGEFRDRHLRHRENRVRAVEWQHVEPTNDRVAQVLGHRFLRAAENLFATNDLQNAALVGPVADVDPRALRAG